MPLYRFYMTTNVQAAQSGVAVQHLLSIQSSCTNSAYWSHLVDGVVDLTVRAYDPNGFGMTNTYELITTDKPITFTNQNTLFSARRALGVCRFLHVQQHRARVGGGGAGRAGRPHAPARRRFAQRGAGLRQMNYLSNHVGQVHLFRQRVMIRNVDPTAYQ